MKHDNNKHVKTGRENTSERERGNKLKRRYYIVAFPSLIDSKITSSIIVMATHNSAIRIGKLMRRHWS